ncbi:MAG: RDD family protein [Chloroflexota bacterium]
MTDPTPVDPAAPEMATPPPAAQAPAASTTWTPPASTNAFVYADLPNRVIAYIIDIVVIVVINVVIGIILAAIGLAASSGTGATAAGSFVGTIIFAIVSLAISGAYFIYSWTRNRATLGMRALGLQIGSAPNGTTITTDQAVRRWLALGAIFSIAQVFNPIPLIGLILSVAALAWVIFLLYTTWKSPTKQGWHDVFANTMIVKATKSAG